MAGVEERTRENGGSKGRVSVPRGTMGACGGVKGRERIRAHLHKHQSPFFRSLSHLLCMMIYDTGTSEFACNCGSGAQSGGSRGKKPMQNRQRTQKNESTQNHRNLRSPFAARNQTASAVRRAIRAIYVWTRRAKALRYCARTFPAGRREHTVCCRNYVWGRTRGKIHLAGVRPKRRKASGCIAPADEAR